MLLALALSPLFTTTLSIIGPSIFVEFGFTKFYDKNNKAMQANLYQTHQNFFDNLSALTILV